MRLAIIIFAYLAIGYVVLGGATTANLFNKTRYGSRSGFDGDERIVAGLVVLFWPMALAAGAAMTALWGFSKSTEAVAEFAADRRDAYIDYRRQLAAKNETITGEIHKARESVDEWLRS